MNRFIERTFVLCVLLVIPAMMSISGCIQHRAYFSKPSIPIRLAEPIKGVKVYVKNSKGEMIEATADLYPGLWIFVDPKEWTTAERAKALNLTRVKKDE